MAVGFISKQLKSLMEDPLPYCSAAPIDDDIFNWAAIIIGPPDCPHENGIFNLSIKFPRDYPFKPPEIKFITKIFHPNIYNDGSISMNILRYDWSPALSISKVLFSICFILSNPLTENPLDTDAALLYYSDRKAFDEKAKLYTVAYAY